MDDYMFRSYVKDCKTVSEATSYLEILNYTVSRLSTAGLSSLRKGSGGKEPAGWSCLWGEERLGRSRRQFHPI